MQIFVRDKGFYRRFFSIAVPVVLQSMIIIGVNMMDTIMLGSFGEIQISGSALSNNFYMLFVIFCLGMGGGTAVLTAQYWGRRDIDSLKRVLTLMIRICVTVSLFFTLVTMFWPGRILSFYTSETAVVDAGIKYYSFLAYTFLFQGLSMTCSIVLRSVGAAFVPLYASAAAFGVNIFFNWMFIFGHFGAPRMEIAGAAVGTLLARILEAGIILGYLFFRDKRISFHPRDLLLPCASSVRSFLSYGAPVMVSDMLLAFGGNAIAMILGRLGSNFVAANSITMVLMMLSQVFSQGLANASGFMTGNTLGEGKTELAYRQAITFLALAVILGLCAGGFIILISDSFIKLYNVNDETRRITLQLMKLVGVLMVFNNVSFIMTKGVLRGGGDTKFLMVADMLFLWVASVPLGYLSGLVWHLHPTLIFLCLMSDRILNSIWCVHRLFSKKWIRIVY